MMNPLEFLARCAALARRGLGRGLAAEVAAACDERILVRLEGLSRSDLARLQRLYDKRAAAQQALAKDAGTPLCTGDASLRARIEELRREAAPFVEASRAFEARRCRRLCCPAAVPHDRTHPLCVVRPRVWQDEGDQA